MDIIIHTLVNTIPYQLLGYYPFWKKHLRFTARKTFLLLSLLVLIKCACFLAISYTDKAPLRFLEFFFGIIHLSSYLIMVHMPPGKTLFLYFFVVAYMSIIRGISYTFEAWLFYNPDMSFMSYTSSFLNIAVIFVTAPLAFFLFKKTCSEITTSRDTHLFAYFWIVPALTICTSLVYSLKLTPDSVREPAFLFSRFFLMSCVLVEYYILIVALKSVRTQAILEERVRSAESLSDVRKEQYALLKNRIDETRRARHDLRQHLTLIQGYIEHGDKEALSDYIQSYGRSLPDSDNLIYCDNYAVDTLARYYLEQAKAEGIVVDVSLPLPKELPFPEPELCILFGNLLENALTACRQITYGERYIRVRALFAPPDGLSITVDNSYIPGKTSDEAASDFDNQSLSGYDRPGLGLGLSSIRHIANRFRGISEFKQTENEFRASVLLYADSL